MKIVNASPIIQGVLKEVLTYYTSKEVKNGSLVQIPLRGKSVPGIVTSFEDANDAKTKLKSSHFSLKRLERVIENNFLLPEFIEAANETASFYAGTIGGILSGVIPTKILEEYLKPKGVLVPFLKDESVHIFKTILPDRILHADKFAIQANHEDRFSVYRGVVREEFARGSSIFLTCASSQSVSLVAKELSRGIEQYTFTFSGKMSPKEMTATWKAVLETEHPVLIIATPIFSSLPRKDFGAFIIEQESKDSYQTFSRPYFDFRYFLERYAEKMVARFILGDSFLRVETLRRYEEKKLSSIIPLRFRLLSNLEQKIVDTRKEKLEATTPDKGWRVISAPLQKAMQETLEAGGNVFLFGVRKGLAPLTACRDCGNVLTCPHCSVPYVLHREGVRNIFICHKCEERKKTEIKCPVCESWRLLPLGIGVELAAAEAKEMFPNTPVFELNADAVKNEKVCNEISVAFNQARGSILIGTEFSLPFVERASLVGVVSIDSLFSLPDYRTNEKILRKLLEVKSKAEKLFIVQTRYTTEKIFRALIQGNLMDFYKDEIADRLKYGYPPASIMIKIRFDGTDADVAEKGAIISEMFKKYDVKIFPAFIPKIKDRFLVNALIKVRTEDWPSRDLIEKLTSLPPYFKVKIDPEDLL